MEALVRNMLPLEEIPEAESMLNQGKACETLGVHRLQNHRKATYFPSTRSGELLRQFRNVKGAQPWTLIDRERPGNRTSEVAMMAR
jgi:hypothetical protein